jgi:hypothetical protein
LSILREKDNEMVTTLLGKSLDKFEQIAVNAQFWRAILGNDETGEFELYAPEQLPLSEGQLRALRARGLSFCGAVGIVDGVALTSFETPLGKRAEDAIGRRFAEEFDAQADSHTREQVEKRLFEQYLSRLMGDAAQA